MLAAGALVVLCELPCWATTQGVPLLIDCSAITSAADRYSAQRSEVMRRDHSGAKVAVCELPFGYVSSDAVGGAGGTCVLRGCVPKKLMVYASSFVQEFQESRGFG